MGPQSLPIAANLDLDHIASTVDLNIPSRSSAVIRRLSYPQVLPKSFVSEIDAKLLKRTGVN